MEKKLKEIKVIIKLWDNILVCFQIKASQPRLLKTSLRKAQYILALSDQKKKYIFSFLLLL